MSRGVWGASGCPTSVQKEALIAGPGPEPDVAELAATITLYRHPGLKPEMVVVFEAPEIWAEKMVKIILKIKQTVLPFGSPSFNASSGKTFATHSPGCVLL